MASGKAESTVPRIDDDEPVLLLRRRKPSTGDSSPALPVRGEEQAPVDRSRRPVEAQDDSKTRVRARVQGNDDVTRMHAPPVVAHEQVTVIAPSPSSDSLTKRTSRSELLDRALGRPSAAGPSHDAVTKIARTASLLEDPAARRARQETSSVRAKPEQPTVIHRGPPPLPSTPPVRKGSRLPPVRKRSADASTPPVKGEETILASVELRGRPRPPAPSGTVAIALVQLAGNDGFVLRYLGAVGHVLADRRFADSDVAKMYAMHEQDIRPHEWIDRSTPHTST